MNALYSLQNQDAVFAEQKLPLLIAKHKGVFSANYYRFYRNKLLLRFLLCLLLSIFAEIASAQLTVVPDPACSANCCTPTSCNCTAGVIASGGTAPYTYQVLGPSGPAGTSACVTGLCPGNYTFIVRDALGATTVLQVQVGGVCCHITCPNDTSFCFNVPDSLIKLNKPTYTSSSPNAGGTGPGTDCVYDSMWNNAPLVYPVGTTVVKWYVRALNGQIDSCTMNVVRNPPSLFTIKFGTSPPIVGGVINICNGQSITFVDSSIGTSGRLWNFGNGYYSGNAIHTEPPSHYPPGTYYDTLTVYDACGTPHDTAFMVVVDSASGPDIYCISVVCPGDTVTYHTNFNCTNYNWTVTGGVFYPVPATSSDSATVIWGSGPQGTIALSVSGCTPPTTCTIATIKTIEIVPATLAIEGDTVICAGSTTTYCVHCIPGNNHSWELMPANAGTVTGQNTCCITVNWNPTFTGIATIVVNYQNVLTGSGCNLPESCSHDNGCGGSGIINVNVLPIFGISGPAKVCPGMISSPFNGMNLTTNTIASGVSWKLITPVPTTYTFASTALFNAYAWTDGPGIYQLTAYAPPGVYCNDSAMTTVEVVDIKIPNAISGPDTVCAGVPVFYSVVPNMTGVTYTWNVTGGTLVPPVNGSSVAIIWGPGGGTVSVYQTLTASPGCVSSSTVAFVVKTWPAFTLPVITASAPIVCLKGTITYSIPLPLISNGTYTWSVVPATAGNIMTANGTNQISIKWVDNSNPNIFVKLKISRCYEDSVMLPVTLLSLPPVPSISYLPSDPCIFDPVSFTTSSTGPIWHWNFGDNDTSVFQNPVHPYLNSGDFTVQLYVTNAQGCSDTAYTKVHVDSIPIVPVITGNSNVCLGAFANYTFSEPLFNGASYTWSLTAPVKGNVVSSSSTNMYMEWTSPGTDTIKLRVQSACLDTTVYFVVTINPLPTPGISVPSPACEGTALSFSGSGGVSYSWSFGGGTANSTVIQNPLVTYPTAANYPVSLTVTDANGCVKTTTTTVTINPLPLAVITGPNSVCALPATVTISAVAAAGYTYVWNTSATTASITPTISFPSSFSVVVTNSFGCSRTSNTIFINGGYCPNDTSICAVNDSLDFSNSPPVCLSTVFTKTGTDTLVGWDFGDGGTAGPVNPVSHTYALPGIYLVQVLGVSYGTGSTGACVDTIARYHLVTIPFDARFDYSFQCNGAGVMQTVFSNTSLYLNSASGYNWTWYDVSTSTTLSTNPFPGPQTLSAGTHVISLSVFDPITLATCTVTKTIVVPVPIVANFSVSTPVCQGSAATFTDLSVLIGNETSRLFNNGNGGTSNLAVANLIYANAPGPYNATLTVTDIYGCTSVATQSITVTPAGTGTLTVGPPTCDSVMLTASGTGPFIWNTISPPPSPPNPVWVKQSGFYKVTATGGNGCPYTAGPVQVTVKKSPAATISGKINYCQGENLDLKTTSAGVSFAWIRLPSTPVGGNAPNLTSPANIPGNVTYQVTVTAANGCTATATYTVYVDPVPGSAVIDSSGSLTFCDGDSVMLTVNPPGVNYLWSKSPTPALTSPANTNDTLYASVSGTYSVIVTTLNGCAYPAISPVTVTVNPNPVVNISGDTVLCEGETLKLVTAPIGGATYSWIGPNANGNTNPFVKANIQLSDSGYYSVTVTNPYGCSATDSIFVVVNPSPPTPFITSNPGGVLCEGQLYTLIATPVPVPPVYYTWSTAQMGDSIKVARAGDYSVTATNQFGCTSSSNVITIHPLPDLSCIPSGCYEFCNECDSVTIPGVPGFASNTWQMLVGGIWTFYSASQNLTVVPPGGKYRLLASNGWGCADSSDTLNIDFKDCCPPPDTLNCKDTCTNFNNIALNGFVPEPLSPNVLLSIDNTGSQGGNGDYYLKMQDQPGPSLTLAGDQYDGKWCCGTFCFDFRLFDDGGTGVNINPKFTIMNGNLGFSFQSSVVVNQGNGWHSICAPVSDCNPPPVSANGAWIPVGATVPNDWTTVLSNVTDVIFKVDYTAAANEISAIDNVCLNSSVPSIHANNDTTVCAGSVLTLNVQGCTGQPEWYELSGDSLIYLVSQPLIDVTPTQNTCYVVICCASTGCCCDTDTVCVTVNPLPVIKWQVNYGNVCLNGDSILLDTANIFVFIGNAFVPISNLGGTITFSGIGVIGNYFYPNSLGPHLITVSFTDSLGCTSSTSITINVISCCVNTCNADAGPDQFICLGNPAILHTQGCDSSATWYSLGPEGPVLVGIGQEVDIFPQQSMCYMLICCGTGNCCCDTDTVCITVNPAPIIQWPVQYQTVCQYSDSIYLDTANIFIFVNNTWIPIANAGGSGVFTGTGVVGNYWYPTTLGANTVTYYYTDSLGCSASVTITINVISCCVNTCNADAGPDQVICLGNPAILHTQGCDSSATWYSLGPEGPVLVGIGQEVDIFPQQSMCYMLICCGTGNCCCDTDTVCITVNPPPIIQWPVQYQTVCQYSDSIYLDTANIFIFVNNTWIPIANAGGNGVFTGTGVVGNYWYPTTLGANTVTYYYTDSLGCSASVTITINVISCCVNTCNADAGPDQVICLGNPAILHTQGCDSSATWYSLGPEGPVFVGIGQEVDIFPQQSMCYMLICCGTGNCCCDTDTVCITVNPLPVLHWTTVIPDVCSNAAPVLLDTANIFVWMNNSWVSVSNAGGTGVFTGPGVSGNYFYPSVPGTYTITYYYTDANGCTSSVTTTITVISCGCDPVSCGCNSFPAPPPPTLTIVSVDPDNCHNDGCIHINATGCCLMYSYSYFDPCDPMNSYSVPQSPNPSILCNLRAGNYIIYVQDACGNTVQQMVTVPLASGPLFAFVQYSMCGDSICVSVEGGCPPYSYNWGNGNTNSCIGVTEHCVGMAVTITDSRGCSITKLVTAPQFNFTNIVNPGCCAATGSLCVTGCFGEGPYAYSWSNGGSTSCISGLAAGTYCVTVTNGAGEQFTCCYTLTNQTYTPPSVSFVFNNCGNSVTAVIGQNGCGQYATHWDNNSTELIREGIHPCDTLTFTVVGCDGSQTHHGFRVPNLLASISPVNCATGYGSICAEIECLRCGPYTYNWSPAAPWQDNSSSCFGAAPGIYTLCVTNSCGDMICCEFYLPPALNMTVSTNIIGPCLGMTNGSIQAFVSGGTPPYTYNWSNGSSTSAISGIGVGSFTLVVTDANGCIAFTSGSVNYRLCRKWIDVHVFIDGFYQNPGSTSPMDNYGSGGCLYLAGVSGNISDVDTMRVTLMDPLTLQPVAESFGILQTDGYMNVIFEDSTLDGHSYYIRLNHRNSIETWSAVPVSMTDPVEYNFTDDIAKAYGNNMRDLGNGHFAIWSGDVNQDGFVESADYSMIENDSQLFLYGYYVTDVTGDVFVESADYSLIENNSQLFLIASQP